MTFLIFRKNGNKQLLYNDDLVEEDLMNFCYKVLFVTPFISKVF